MFSRHISATPSGLDPALAAILAPVAHTAVGYEVATGALGYPQITGYEAVVGALLNAQAVAAAQMHPSQAAAVNQARQIAQAAQSRNALLLDDKAPTRSVGCGFGFGVTNVAALTNATITKRPQVFFRPSQLIVPSDIAGYFDIEDIRVGKEPVFVVAGSAPARAFTEVATGANIRPTTASISADITLSISNVSAVAQDFRAYMKGESVE